MPLEGLPIVLEKTLDAHLSHFALQSWKTKGGQKFSQVTIRFVHENMAAGEIQYRRTPPSRLARDNARARQRQLQNTREISMTDQENADNVLRTVTDVMDTLEVVSGDENTALLSNDPQVIADDNNTNVLNGHAEMAPVPSLNTEPEIISTYHNCMCYTLEGLFLNLKF